jgi:hypothetical protein
MTLPNKGAGLEARVQRLFIALGMHAERGLNVRTGRRDTRMATDIDVLATVYAQDFHRSIYHAECKGEKNAQILDRVFWLAGVRKLLGAERSLLVILKDDPISREFAKRLDVETLSSNVLRDMEDTYKISDSWWPGRANYHVWDNLHPTRSKYDSVADMNDRLLAQVRSMYLLCYEEGWRGQPYAPLNRLLRLFSEMGEESKRLKELTPSLLQVVRLSVSYGLVRLSHYLLTLCRDVVAMQPIERSQYLADRLMFGNMDALQSRAMTDRSVRMVRAALAEHNIEAPARWSTDILLQPPNYHQILAESIQRLWENPEQAVNLPFAMELIQFGFQPEPRGVVESLVSIGRPAVEVVKAFLVQGLSMPSSLLEPPDSAALNAINKPLKVPQKGDDDGGQSKLVEGQ